MNTYARTHARTHKKRVSVEKSTRNSRSRIENERVKLISLLCLSKHYIKFYNTLCSPYPFVIAPQSVANIFYENIGVYKWIERQRETYKIANGSKIGAKTRDE